MPRVVSCPACRHSFAAPDNLTGVAPCPRCHGQVACPATAIQADAPPSPSGIQADPPRKPPSATLPCPYCGKWIAEVCLFCPHCERPVGADLRQPLNAVCHNRSPSLLDSRPVRVTGAAVAALGTGVAVAASLNAFLRPQADTLSITLGVIPLAFLAVIWLLALVFAFLPGGCASRRRGVGELLFEAASAVGLLMLILFAAGVFLATVCAVAG